MDRFIFIVFPLKYDFIVTMRKALAMALLSTLAATALSVWYGMEAKLPWDKVRIFEFRI